MSKIKITILGTTAGVPTVERGHTAIYLSYDDGEEYCCLFDCGENTQRQLKIARLNMMKIEDLFITHWHGDHCLGLPGLVDTMAFDGREAPMGVYAPQARRVRKSLRFSHSMGNFKMPVCNVPAKGDRVTSLLETERFSIVSMPARHNVPSVSYALMEKDKKRIDLEKARKIGLPEKGEIYKQLKTDGEILLKEKRITFEDIAVTKKGKRIVYSGDTEICDNLKRIAHGADLLIQDCTYFDEKDSAKLYKHATLPEIIEMVSREDVKKTVLTHISRKYQDMDQLRFLIKDHPNLAVAEDFMTVVV